MANLLLLAVPFKMLAWPFCHTRRRACILGSLAALGAPVDAARGDSPVEPFASAEALNAWSFSNGPEYPGAAGDMEWDPSAGRASDGALVLSFDFANGGNYVAAMVQAPDVPGVVALRCWLLNPSGNLVIIRAVDHAGETFQKNLPFDYPGWQEVEVTLGAWEHAWGGDGAVDVPVTRVDILVENQGSGRRGRLVVDDLTWLTAEQCRSDTDDRRDSYVESRFEDPKSWLPRGPAVPVRDGNSWQCTFSDDADHFALTYGRSLLGRPVQMALTIESDGGGAVLSATLASHFQRFDREIGVLDAPGEQTIRVPLGDLASWSHAGGEDDGIVRYPVRLERLTVTRGAGKPVCRLRLKHLLIETAYSGRAPVILEPRGQMLDDGTARFAVRCRQLTSSPMAGQLRYRLYNLDRGREQTIQDVRLPASGDPLERSFTASFDGATMLEARFDFAGAGVTTREVSVTVARREPATPLAGPRPLQPGSRIGAGLYLYRFHGHLDARSSMDRVCRLAADAGVRWTREEFHWNWIEAQRGRYDFTFFDQLVEAAHAEGISVYGLVCYWTDWTGPPLTEAFIAEYCTFLRILVARYRDRIRHWEIWNEPNIFFWPGPRELYAKLLAAAYTTIKSVDPDAEVLGCSTAGIDTKFIRQVLDQAAPFDALTVHPYRHALDVPGFVAELQRVSELVDKRPVWITEMGWSSPIGGISERAQAGLVARTYLAALASDAVRSVAWYDFREDGIDPHYHEHHFGLVRQDLTPKIGYRALAAVGRLFPDARAAQPMDLPEGLTGYAFINGERKTVAGTGSPGLAAVWAEQRAQLCEVRGAGRVRQLLNAMGEPAQQVSHDGGATVLLQAGLPIYVLADRPGELQVVPSGIDVRLAQHAYHPGSRVRLAEGSDRRHVDASAIVLPAGWHAAPEGDALTVVPEYAPPGRYTIELTLRPAGTNGPGFVLPVTLDVVPALVRG